MKRLVLHLAAASSIVLAATLLPAAPASATVHEIVAQWCSGQEPLEPAGISGGSQADNFGKPLFASRFIRGTVPFTGSAGPGQLIDFDFGHPASKVVGTGVFVVVGSTPDGPLYLQLITPDPSFPAFQQCPRLAG